MDQHNLADVAVERFTLETAKIAAAEAWENMENSERSWLLGLYEDMHYDYVAGYSYTKKKDTEYGIWEYYLEHANELWRKYGNKECDGS